LKAKRWQEAERTFRDVLDRFEETEAAPEAFYWAGVSRYKASGDATALKETAAAFGRRYRESAWAKKASIEGVKPRL
jgi:TolA-binding protein